MGGEWGIRVSRCKGRTYQHVIMGGNCDRAVGRSVTELRSGNYQHRHCRHSKLKANGVESTSLGQVLSPLNNVKN